VVSGKVADVEAKVEVGGEISAKDGASVNASAAVSHGGVEVGRGVSANGEGVKAGTRVGAGANKDFKVGAKLRLALGFGVKVNVTQAARAAAHTRDFFAHLATTWGVQPTLAGFFDRSGRARRK